jgi:hypothetical protein
MNVVLSRELKMYQNFSNLKTMSLIMYSCWFWCINFLDAAFPWYREAFSNLNWYVYLHIWFMLLGSWFYILSFLYVSVGLQFCWCAKEIQHQERINWKQVSNQWEDRLLAKTFKWWRSMLKWWSESPYIGVQGKCCTPWKYFMYVRVGMLVSGTFSSHAISY